MIVSFDKNLLPLILAVIYIIILLFVNIVKWRKPHLLKLIEVFFYGATLNTAYLCFYIPYRALRGIKLPDATSDFYLSLGLAGVVIVYVSIVSFAQIVIKQWKRKR